MHDAWFLFLQTICEKVRDWTERGRYWRSSGNCWSWRGGAIGLGWFSQKFFFLETTFASDSQERLHQAHQAVESDDRVQTNGSRKRSSLAEDYLPRFQVTFRFSLLQDQLFFFTFAGSLISTRTDSSTRESFVGWPLLQWSVHKSYKPSFRFWILCSWSDVSRVF